MNQPSDVSARLRHIAAKIDASRKPDKALVAREIRSLLAAIEPSGEKPAPKKYEPGVLVPDAKKRGLSLEEEAAEWEKGLLGGDDDDGNEDSYG